uniref:HIT domain-containing protein n=1 Tax=Angiostrongylus costaricensis TaxID=334426 RepID=A0A158PHX1_ANGCS
LLSFHTSLVPIWRPRSDGKFFEIFNKKTFQCVIIRDIKPRTPHHFLAVSKAHINKPTDLTAADIPLLIDMEKTGREFLRVELKAKGEADTIEDMLRVGFHWPPLITENHLHMHILYPIKELGFFSRNLIFRPGMIFRPTSEVIEELKKSANVPDPLKGNPAKNDEHNVLPAHAVAN